MKFDARKNYLPALLAAVAAVGCQSLAQWVGPKQDPFIQTVPPVSQLVRRTRRTPANGKPAGRSMSAGVPLATSRNRSESMPSTIGRAKSSPECRSRPSLRPSKRNRWRSTSWPSSAGSWSAPSMPGPHQRPRRFRRPTIGDGLASLSCITRFRLYQRTAETADRPGSGSIRGLQTGWSPTNRRNQLDRAWAARVRQVSIWVGSCGMRRKRPRRAVAERPGQSDGVASKWSCGDISHTSSVVTIVDSGE